MKSLVLGRGLIALAAGLLFAACAGGSGTQELKTLSDQTADQKRAGIRLQLAVGYYQQGQYEVALDEIKKAITSDPQSADAYGVRALIYMAMGEQKLAEDNFLHALKLAPQNPELSNNYGSFLCQSGRAAPSLAYFDAAIKNRSYASPESALVNAGRCSLKLRNVDAAERYLTEALRIAPDLVAVNQNLAQVYLERRDLERAGFFINRIRSNVKLETMPADVLWLAIRVEHKRGDKAAEATLAALLRRNYPGSPEFAAFQRGAFDE